MTVVLKWAWRHHVLEVEPFDSLDEAARSAQYQSDAGDEALACVEVVGDAIYTAAEVFALPAARDLDGDFEDVVLPTVRVDVRAPATVFSAGTAPSAREWAGVEWLHSDDEAEGVRALWAERVGDDRVRLTPLGRT